jgi:hypothetical protein
VMDILGGSGGTNPQTKKKLNHWIPKY